jgi:hypothetical protein
MIYLRFSVSRSGDALENTDGAVDHGTAQFMFVSEDAAEASRRAAAALRTLGWRAVAIVDAREGYSREEFGPDCASTLFSQAQEQGMACVLRVSQGVEAMPASRDEDLTRLLHLAAS